MLTKIAKQQLMKAGWYEGRKIDISDFVKRAEEQGHYVFPAAKKFFEEFGELTIIDQIIDDEGNIDINQSMVMLNAQIISTFEFDIFDNWAIEKNLNKKVILVLFLNHEEIPIYIAEDGKFYTLWYGGGLVANDSDQLWNEYYADMWGVVSWERLKKGAVKELQDYDECDRKYL